MPANPSPAHSRFPVDSVALAQALVRFDTSNPPGNEGACIQHVKSLLDDVDIPSQVFAKSPNRPNLVARLTGDGSAPPLLLQWHIDVVPAGPTEWEHPAFGGDMKNGFLWGRGTLDMKGGIAMMLAAVIKAKSEGLTPAGDIILALAADEEAGRDLGAGYLVTEHKELFAGVRYAIGEFGGFSFNLGGRRFYPIMVAEKQVCHLRATFRGADGHASLRQQANPLGDMARFLDRVQSHELPVHVTPEARLMFEAIRPHLPFLLRQGVGLLLDPRMTALVLKLLGARDRTFSPLFRNTLTPTIVRCGDQINVAPGEASVDLDGRLLPGFGPEKFLSELAHVAGGDAEVEVLRHDQGGGPPDLGLFPFLEGLLVGADPEGIPVPMLMPAATDGRLFARLGIQTYGFLPMLLPESLDFGAAVHGPNERIPVEARTSGAGVFYNLLRRYGRGA